MIKGPVGSGSLFEKYNAPLWLYIITITGCVVSFILYLNSLSPALSKVGDIEIHRLQVSIKKGKRAIVIPSSKISKFKLMPDYRFSHEKGDKRKRILQISTDELESSYDIEVTQTEEDELNNVIQQIIDSQQRV